MLWANKAAITRFGRALTPEEREALVSGYPPAALEVCIEVMTKLHSNVVVSCSLLPAGCQMNSASHAAGIVDCLCQLKGPMILTRLMQTCICLRDALIMSGVLQVNGECMNHRVDPRRSLKQIFTSIRPEETAANIADGVGSSCPLCFQGHEGSGVSSKQIPLLLLASTWLCTIRPGLCESLDTGLKFSVMPGCFDPWHAYLRQPCCLTFCLRLTLHHECLGSLAQPFPVKIDGQPVRAVLSQLEDTFETANPDAIRAGLMQKQSPIHSYLFDAQGKLLMANLKALNKWQARGRTSGQGGHSDSLRVKSKSFPQRWARLTFRRSAQHVCLFRCD